MSKSIVLCRDGNIVAVDSVTPTLFVISEGGDLLRWVVLSLDFFSQASDIFQFFLILCMQVWLCWLHEGAKRHSGGGKGVLCLWFQGYFPSMYMAVASEKLPKSPTKDKIVPPGPQCGGIHRGRGLREADRVSGEGGCGRHGCMNHIQIVGVKGIMLFFTMNFQVREHHQFPQWDRHLWCWRHSHWWLAWKQVFAGTFFFGPYCWAWPYDGLIFAHYNGIHVHF